MKTKNINFLVATLAAGLALFNAAPSAVLADNAVPITTSISPSSVAAGSSAFTLTVNGNNFVPDSSVIFNGSTRSTTYISSSQLTASIPASDVDTVGVFSVRVMSPAPGGGTSNDQTFTVNNTTPMTTSISPSSMAVGSGGFTLTVNGNNFIPSSMVSFAGSARSTNYVSSTQLTASILTSDLDSVGTFNVTVANPGPGGGISNAQVFTVTGTANNPIPLLTVISPSSLEVGSGSFTMTLSGANFTPTSFVRFNGIPRSTTYVSPNQLTAVILASDIALSGLYAVSVTNPAPGGGISNTVMFTVNSMVGTPSLPNTGFGPSDDKKPGIEALMASFALLGVVLAALKSRKIWLTK